MLSERDTKKKFDDYKSLITDYPLFCLLNADEIHELTQIAEEKTLDLGTLITKEGDIVDSVYLIFSGTAKVTRNIVNIEKTELLNVATLRKGDAIGLTDTGFFSHKGIRTATVTATSPMVLLKFGLNDFQNFLKRPGVTYPGLKNVGEKLLLMNFISESHLFKHFNIDQIHLLAKKMRKIPAPANTVIFKDGDLANEHYYVVSGKVGISLSAGKTEKIYEANTIFGEDEYIHKGKHKANAYALEDCELFILSSNDVMKAEKQHGFIHKLIGRIKKAKHKR